MIGDEVKVIVDRPMGSRHPNHNETVYPINYGYIDGLIAPDGEEQDAYILGVNEPVDCFVGEVIAVIRRFDDVEEKWVVAPKGMTFKTDEIRKLTDFQEKYFHIEIIR